LRDAIALRGAPIVVGIDPVLERLPGVMRPQERSCRSACAAIEKFSREVIDAVATITPVVKINSAFFEAYYEFGIAAYYRLIERAHEQGLLVIGDIKRSDIGSTARLYARGHLRAPHDPALNERRVPDAVTLSGYLGYTAVAPFLDAARERGAGVYILVRPSDPHADAVHEFGAAKRFYEHMASLVHDWGAAPELIGRCGLSCVGAVVAPKDETSTRALRDAMPHTPWLVPGYGAQGATADACGACFRATGDGAIVNASRSVIYAFEDAAALARHNSDWRACVATAAQRFAADVARAVSPP
jgi:orotidine-5'-phosphate decarboxylase